MSLYSPMLAHGLAVLSMMTIFLSENLGQNRGSKSYKLFGAKSRKARFQRACRSWSYSTTLLRQYDRSCLHTEEGRDSLLDSVHRESQTLERGLSEEGNGETAILASFGGECSGRLSKLVSVRNMGFQVAPLRVSKGVPQTARHSNSAYFCIV